MGTPEKRVSRGKELRQHHSLERSQGIASVEMGMSLIGPGKYSPTRRGARSRSTEQVSRGG